jgi:hypothetical protein
LPVNFATNARVNLNDSAMPVVTSVLLSVASYLVSNSEGFDWIGAGNACKQICHFLPLIIGELRE